MATNRPVSSKPQKNTVETVDSGVLARLSETVEGLCNSENEKEQEAGRHARTLKTAVSEFDIDQDIIAGAALFPLLASGCVSKTRATKEFGQRLTHLAAQLADLGGFGFPKTWDPTTGLNVQQTETLRKMLLAVVDDVRLVLVLLCDQVYRLEQLKKAPLATQQLVALETREIHAPLASRLGIWQLKWQLEDFAFRYLEPDTYKQIAKFLRENRRSREAYIQRVIDTLKEKLDAANIPAEIHGRPKHMYSIWKKMQKKQVPFQHIFDVRAVRILVNSVAECYAVLGIIHGNWPYIPGEFDDYIATPKGNNYQSLHTAVIGAENNTLEVQIRTPQMHEHAELGVAAHWRYKEAARHDDAFDQKINWLRQILEPSQEEVETSSLIDRFKAEIFEDRVYALTPAGKVVDLPAGATPLDFAYYVHTDLGHRCRGAKVNGRMVQLTYTLSNGEQVEIISAKNGHPSRDWLIPRQGYLASPRSRAKVRQWFRRQDREHQMEQGRALLQKELQRHGLDAPHLNALAKKLGQNSPTELYVNLGSGDLDVSHLDEAIDALLKPVEEPQLPKTRRRKKSASKSAIDVDGIGDLLCHYAKCCSPLPPDPISGYITLGRGVTIHRSDCRNLLRLRQENAARILDVNWGRDKHNTYPVDITIKAFDRRGLIKDVSSLLAAEEVNIQSFDTKVNTAANTVLINLTAEISGLDELSRIIHRVAQVPNVFEVRRREH